LQIVLAVWGFALFGEIRLEPSISDSFTPIALSPGINITGSVTTGEAYSTSTSYLTTAACTANFLYASPPIALTGTGQIGFPLSTLGVPTTVQRSDDYYLVSILITGPNTLRTSSIAFHAAGPRSLAVGPVLPTVSVAAIPGGYRRLQATFGTIPTTTIEALPSSIPTRSSQ
jgi:hypothetical protein